MIRITGEQQTQGITLVNTGRDCAQLLAKSYFQLLSLRQARKRVRRDRHGRVRAEKKVSAIAKETRRDRGTAMQGHCRTDTIPWHKRSGSSNGNSTLMSSLVGDSYCKSNISA